MVAKLLPGRRDAQEELGEAFLHARKGAAYGDRRARHVGPANWRLPAASRPANFYALPRKSPHITGFAPVVTIGDPERLLSAPNDRQPE